MGPRKGGGRAGFLKGSRRPQGEDGGVEEAHAAPAAPAAHSEEAAAEQTPAVSKKASAFLKDSEPEPAAPAPAASAKAKAFLKDASDDDEDDGSGNAPIAGEPRGHLLQRHKREAKALKEQAKRLGKKGKEEMLKAEAELEKRQAAELADLVQREGGVRPGADAAVALADSLYSVSLADPADGGEEERGGGKKQSKSQKRREAKQREEAEREARIAAELAEAGDSERVVEERALRGLLRPLGLAVADIPADGHCLYRSIEHQLRALPELPPALPDAAAAAFPALRRRAAEHMRTHPEDFRPFVLQEDVADEGGADGGTEEGGTDAYEAYCSEVEGTAAWGGQVEAQALAGALGVRIQVYSVGLPVVEMGQEHSEDGARTLRVCYLRHAYGLGEHYNAIVPRGAGEEEEEEEEAAAGADAAAEEED